MTAHVILPVDTVWLSLGPGDIILRTSRTDAHIRFHSRSSWIWAGCGHLGPSWQYCDGRFLSLSISNLKRKNTMGTSEGAPQQQHAAVLALIGILAFIFIIGAVLFKRLGRPVQPHKTQATEVKAYLPTITDHVKPLCRDLEVPALQRLCLHHVLVALSTQLTTS